MANTSAAVMVKTLGDILAYGNNTGSVNLYMAYGGSNFGYWAGAICSCSALTIRPSCIVPAPMASRLSSCA